MFNTQENRELIVETIKSSFVISDSELLKEQKWKRLSKKKHGTNEYHRVYEFRDNNAITVTIAELIEEEDLIIIATTGLTEKSGNTSYQFDISRYESQPSGSMSDYIFEFLDSSKVGNGFLVIITPKKYWLKNGHWYDRHFDVSVLEKNGLYTLMPSVFETTHTKQKTEQILLSIGMTREPNLISIVTKNMGF